MRVTRYGQSALLIEATGTRLLLDPGNLSGDEVFALGELDALLITHEHVDHIDVGRIAELFALSPLLPVYAPQAVLDLVDVPEGARSIAVADGDEFVVGPCTVQVVGRVHQIILPELPRCANVGFVIEIPGAGRLFVPGDSYETIPERVTTLALPLFGPWNSLHDTVEFVRSVAPKHLFPNHDALLSESGRALFRRFIVQATSPAVNFLDTQQGVPFELPANEFGL